MGTRKVIYCSGIVGQDMDGELILSEGFTAPENAASTDWATTRWAVSNSGNGFIELRAFYNYEAFFPTDKLLGVYVGLHHKGNALIKVQLVNYRTGVKGNAKSFALNGEELTHLIGGDLWGMNLSAADFMNRPPFGRPWVGVRLEKSGGHYELDAVHISAILEREEASSDAGDGAEDYSLAPLCPQPEGFKKMPKGAIGQTAQGWSWIDEATNKDTVHNPYNIPCLFYTDVFYKESDRTVAVASVFKLTTTEFSIKQMGAVGFHGMETFPIPETGVTPRLIKQDFVIHSAQLATLVQYFDPVGIANEGANYVFSLWCIKDNDGQTYPFGRGERAVRWKSSVKSTPDDSVNLNFQPTRIDFGTVLVGVNFSKTLVIRNVSGGEGKVNFVAPPRITVSPSSLVIPAQKQFEVRVSFVPFTPGAFNANIEVKSNSQSQPLILLPVLANVIQAQNIPLTAGETVTMTSPVGVAIVPTSEGAIAVEVS